MVLSQRSKLQALHGGFVGNVVSLSLGWLWSLPCSLGLPFVHPVYLTDCPSIFVFADYLLLLCASPWVPSMRTSKGLLSCRGLSGRKTSQAPAGQGQAWDKPRAGAREGPRPAARSVSACFLLPDPFVCLLDNVCVRERKKKRKNSQHQK